MANDNFFNKNIVIYISKIYLVSINPPVTMQTFS